MAIEATATRSLEAFFQDQKLGEISLEDGKLVITEEGDSGLTSIIQSMRHAGMTDEDLFNSLPERYQFRLWFSSKRE